MIRTDPNQWLVHDEPTISAGVRGLEVLALILAGNQLVNHADIEMRATGNVMLRMAQARGRYMSGASKQPAPDRESLDVSRVVAEIVPYLWGEGERPADLDAWWAAMVQFDSRVNSSGIVGGGWVRDLVRGD